MGKECKHVFNLPCYNDRPVDSLDCVDCLIAKASECNIAAEVLMEEHLRRRDKVLEGFKEAKEWLATNL